MANQQDTSPRTASNAYEDVQWSIDALGAMLDAVRVAKGNELSGGYNLNDDTIPEVMYHAINMTYKIKSDIEVIWAAAQKSG